MPLAVRTGVRTPAELIQIWYANIIIQTWEWPNNTRSWRYHYL